MNVGNDEETVKMENTKVLRVKRFKCFDQWCKKVAVVREEREECRQDGTDGEKYRE